jgi:demethylmenaquinone methyltransferase/2-methoxy-6-polyprenyl-1,4-benzoquinol methylase
VSGRGGPEAPREAEAPREPGGAGDPATHFGFSKVPAEQKAGKVAEVFDSVASNYDVMNDLMSAGLHRVWKAFTVRHAALRPGMKVLDIAGGTGDLARAFARRVGPRGEVWLTDINGSMLAIGRDRLLDDGLEQPVAQCDAEALPFPDGYFDRVTVAFGLRNMTRKERALREMHRVLKPGGRLMVLEFSRVWKPLAPAYDAYSFGVLPRLGKLVAGDADSYRYLAESIRMHPDQETLGRMMEEAGFGRVRWHNLTMGVVALHEGVKF